MTPHININGCDTYLHSEYGVCPACDADALRDAMAAEATAYWNGMAPTACIDALLRDAGVACEHRDGWDAYSVDIGGGTYARCNDGVAWDAIMAQVDGASVGQLRGYVSLLVGGASPAKRAPSPACEYEQSTCDECTAGRPQNCRRM